MASKAQEIQNRIDSLNQRRIKALEKQEAKQKPLFDEKNTGNGLLYALESLGLGLLSSVEGAADFLVGGVAELFGADDYAESLMKSDWVNYNQANEWYNPSEGWQFVGDVAQGVSNALPGVALSFVHPALATGYFMSSAAGRSTSEAVKETGELSAKEWLYGTGSGAIEGAIEQFSSGIGGSKLGKIAGKTLAKTTAGKVFTTMAGEGVEEVASDIVNPMLKRVTGVDKKATIDWSSLPRTFGVGALAGGVTGGGGHVIKAATSGGFNNLNANENAQELQQRLADNNTRQAKGKKEIYKQKDLMRTAEALSLNLQKMNPVKRKAFLGNNANISRFFNEDGTVRAYGEASGNYNLAGYSASLQGMEDSFLYKPISANENISEAASQVMKDITSITKGKTNIVFTNESLLAENGGKANGLYKDGIIYLDAKADSYEQLKTVGIHEVMHSLEGTKEYAALGKYISKMIEANPELAKKYSLGKYRMAYDKMLNGEWSVETKEYQAMTEIFADFVADKVMNNEATLKRFTEGDRNFIIKLYQWVKEAIKKLGMSNADRESYKALRKIETLLGKALETGRGGVSLEEVEKGVRLSKESEAKEKTAEKSQDGNAQSVKFAKENADGKVATARYQIKEFNKSAYNFDNAIKSVASMKSIATLQGDEFVLGKGTLISQVVDYYETIGNNAYNEELGDVELIKRGVKDSLAHGIGEQKAAAYYAVPQVISKGKVVDYQTNWKGRGYDTAVIVAPISIAGKEYYTAVVVRRTNNNQRFYLHEIDIKNRQAVLTEATNTNNSKELGGLPINSIFKKIRNVNSFSEKFQKTSTSRKSIDVDSDGNSLTAEQVEYFKDSKVRDENGNLLAMYHGSKADATVFKKEYISSWNMFGKGYYFTSSERRGRRYAKGSFKEVYLNIKNPFFANQKQYLNELYKEINNTEEDIEKYSEEKGIGGRPFFKICNYLDDIGVDVSKIIKSLGYDGIYYEGYDDIEVVAYDSNQIKLTSNKTPTKNVDIRYSIDVVSTKKSEGAEFNQALDEKTTERILTVFDKAHKAAVGERIREAWLRTQIAITDEQAGIIDAGNQLGVPLHGEVQRARASKAAATSMLNSEQRTFSEKKRVGDSLGDIFKPIYKRGKGYVQSFNLYLLHKLNIDRMSAVAKAEKKIQDLFKSNPLLKEAVENKETDKQVWKKAVLDQEGGALYLALEDTKNKPVFEEDVGVKFSQEKLAQLDAQHPEFKEFAAKVHKYSDNLLQYRVDAGLITQEQADQMREMYPNYVPTYYKYNKNGTSGTFIGKNELAIKTGIKRAIGSKGIADIGDISVSLSQQTMAVVRAAAVNQIATKLNQASIEKNNNSFFVVQDMVDDSVDEDSVNVADVDYDAVLPKNGTITFWESGEKKTAMVTDVVFEGFASLGGKYEFGNPLETVMSKVINGFKLLVTSWNPLFSITNSLKDIQEALYYTKYSKTRGKFLAKYGSAMFARKFNPKLKELWGQYVAMGGTQSGYFNNVTGIYDNRMKVRKGLSLLMKPLEAVNNYIEQTPRFAEFVLSVEAGNSLEQALYDSADVTTNFSRGGTMTRKLNRCLIPFLNPSIQGWSKLYRSWVAPMDGLSAKEVERLSKRAKGMRLLSIYGQLVVKAVIFGISVGLFNDLLYRFFDDDEDYKNLPLNVKENYYLIKVGDKKFIKIPKGRVVALWGSIGTRITEYSNGNEKALDVWDWFMSASQMVSPVESASRTILSPLISDLPTNTTWYGGEIESESMQNLAPAERYDEATSRIAIALGKAFNYSPKKIHYLIDQYSGFLGDIILPVTTNKAEQDMVSSRFLVDSLYTNNISTNYYDLKEELTWSKNSGSITSHLTLKYLNLVSSTTSDMYKQKRDIANSNISDKEKQKQTDIVQALLNETLQSATENAVIFEDLVLSSGCEEAWLKLNQNKTFAAMDNAGQKYATNKWVDYYFNKLYAEMVGGKASVETVLYDAIGPETTVLYLTKIKNIESDKDSSGNVIAGSRRKKVMAYIEKLKMSATNKYILMYLAGYKLTDVGQKQVNSYLSTKGYSLDGEQ